MFVWRKQPWIVWWHNLFLEKVDPKKDITNYCFEYMYVTVKLFGIPREARTFTMIHELLEQIGQPSDLE